MESDDLKRVLAAIVLSFIILFGYQYFFAKPAPQVEQEPGVVREEPIKKEKVSPEIIPSESQVGLPPVSPEGITPEKLVRVDTPLYTAELSSRGAVVKKWILKEYSDSQGLPVVLLTGTPSIAPLSLGRETGFELSKVDFRIVGYDLNLGERDPDGQISFVFESGGVIIKRTMKFSADTYKVDVVEEVRGIGNYWLTLGEDFGITGATGYGSHIGPVVLDGTDRDEYNPDKLGEPRFFSPADLKWIALEDKYFLSSLVPLSQVSKVKLWKRQASGLIALNFQGGVNEYALYAGPKAIDDLKPLKLGLEHIIDFGFFSIISRPIFWFLKYINKYVDNFGWSILILTVLIRIPFIPLLNKGQKSMKKLQSLQPKMAEVKEKYKKDPQKMQKEMMELYRRHKVNPMGGCLPMLVQIPIFFALYKVLLVAIELRGAPWALWIHDLSAKDPYYVLPIVMGLSMVIQQKMTPTSADPRQAKMMMFLPVVFTFLFLNFSAGLVLYWLMSNVLSIIQQFFVNKKVAKEQA